MTVSLRHVIVLFFFAPSSFPISDICSLSHHGMVGHGPSTLDPVCGSSYGIPNFRSKAVLLLVSLGGSGSDPHSMRRAEFFVLRQERPLPVILPVEGRDRRTPSQRPTAFQSC
ncbi:hypothetical protein B0H10DRAFT_2028250 [Mycena sp. CBHHK59/15]|nr:hypothetical protein B0H10DRAFT_2028250 [Mycena sp. CBHHK59/15]